MLDVLRVTVAVVLITSAGSAGAVDGLPGDLNADGSVDGNDLGVFAGTFGSSIGASNYLPNADLDGDLDVDLDDYAQFFPEYVVDAFPTNPPQVLLTPGQSTATAGDFTVSASPVEYVGAGLLSTTLSVSAQSGDIAAVLNATIGGGYLHNETGLFVNLPIAENYVSFGIDPPSDRDSHFLPTRLFDEPQNQLTEVGQTSASPFPTDLPSGTSVYGLDLAGGYGFLPMSNIDLVQVVFSLDAFNEGVPVEFDLADTDGGTLNEGFSLVLQVPAPIPGDADFDGDVDGDDLITVQTNFLATGDLPIEGDADFDGDVDGDDLINVQTNFLQTASTSIPEPSAALLVSWTTAGLWLSRKR